MLKKEILAVAEKCIKIELDGLKKLKFSLNSQFVTAVKSILDSKGKLILSGIGKSGHIANKIASTFTSTGIVSIFLHPVEASHGDLGIIEKKDTVILISNSGETSELNDIINYCKKNDVKIICITSNSKSTLANNANIKLILPVHIEADPLGIAPTTSTTLALVLGDVLCSTVLKYKKFDKQAFKKFHPGGKIGKNLKTLGDIMSSDLPLINLQSKMSEVVLVMTEKKFGCAIIIDKNKKLCGIITDGDLRRSIHDDILRKQAKTIMRKKPVMASRNTLVSSAINIMKKNSISSLIISNKNTPEGIVNLKQCLDNE